MDLIVEKEGVFLKKFNNYDLHFRFETKEGVHFENAQYIHPLKQKLVQSYVGCFGQNINDREGLYV